MAPATFTAGHDSADRLINWDRTSGELRAWNLSLVGDWDSYSGTIAAGGSFQQTRTHNPVHEILDVTSDSTAPGLAGGEVTHGAKGNITSERSSGSLRTYTFDADNMLATASVIGGGAEAGSYTYDAIGRRATKTTASGTTVFVSMTEPNGSGMGQVIQEYDDASTTPSRQYVYGSYVDEPLAQVTGSGSLLYYHRNRQFNVVGLTDASGTVQELYRYTPYGSQTILAPDGVTVRTASLFHAGQTPGHQGLHHDAESGLVYNRARYRHTELGRWMGRDPASYHDGMSLYTIARSNVLTLLDPTGKAARITLDEDKRSVNVTLNITLVMPRSQRGGPGRQTAERVKRSIESYWNGHRAHGHDVTVTANVTNHYRGGPRSRSRGGRRTGGSSGVSRTLNRPTGDNIITMVSDPDHRDYVNGGGDRGEWGSQSSDWTYAHEAGHLMGLPDDYTDLPDKGSQPNPGHLGHMMAQVGMPVAQHEIDEVVKGVVGPSSDEEIGPSSDEEIGPADGGQDEQDIDLGGCP